MESRSSADAHDIAITPAHDPVDSEGSIGDVSTAVSTSGFSVVPRRQLGFFQTTAMQLNNSLATGNFWITPYHTLALVRSKRACLLLWAVGGMYAAFGYGTSHLKCV